MKVIMKYLKPFAGTILVSLLILFGQAIGELSLPNLMSDIVNTGIQNGGVEQEAPEALPAEGFALMTLFMDEEDKETFQESYELIEGGSAEAEAYNAEFPESQETDFYVLDETDPEQLISLESIFSKASYSFVTFMQEMGGQQGGTAAVDAESGFENVDLDQLYALVPQLQQLPQEAFTASMDVADAAEPMLYSQIGILFTKLFYQDLGADMDALQNQYIMTKGAQMLAIAVAVSVASVAVAYFSSRIAAKVSGRMRRDVFAKVESFSNTEFDNFSTASLITRTTNDVQQIQQLITIGIRMLCYAPILATGGLIMAIDKSVSLAWTIAVAVIALIGIMMSILSIAMPKFKVLQSLTDRLNLVSRENLSGMMVIRAFGNEPFEENRFNDANEDYTYTNRFVQRLMSLLMPAMMLVMNGVSLLIIWFGSQQVADSALQIGDMMAYIQYVMQIIMAFLMISMMFIFLPRASVSATRIGEVLDTDLSITDPNDAQPSLKNEGLITFKDVSYHYPKASENVLNNISFTARPGETTAIIGSTGSGKSTLINLIPRFYDVTDGAIEIDGIDIRKMTQADLRANIGYVPQKGMLFSGNIVSNIAYGKDDASTDEIMKALEVAQAKNFVSEMEDGIETAIAQGGGNVSGGQKQRLSIARALVKKAPIYIFDDSFSALDFKTDAALRSALDAYTDNATVLIVAQRISTIMDAEQIIVLDKGRIVGIGTHDALMKNCETYQEIAKSQLSEEELA
ncbi:MAG: ABC transporter ATP-binding protein [Trichococcus flocculiformis]|jgi:ATP-binding cassette subfamily B multidrug efflux pump|uniref:ABC transporter ATP-binding protein n=2 Tax=Trichococcus flocculiformis TaxID=82803 RepID=A0A847D4Q4_9LACT|nr:ABC transporter ATP-binding protein [Bacilli bacterium]NLD31565.1 ABC transporter ATP-binding protein [Trichococcus flocculiformis]HAZ58962.1 ABC transporter ATP-binding protein [Trichococcus sp.]HBQ63018.1 ABC transporter ATP-binding protein [Trichococcus sp.]